MSRRLVRLLLMLAAWLLLCPAESGATSPINTVTGSFGMSPQWSAIQTLAGAGPSVNNVQSSTQFTGKSNYTATGATANKCNQVSSKVFSVAASLTTTIDLSAAFTNVVGSTTATWKRIKAVHIQLLSVAQDSANGTACSSITIGNNVSNNWISQSHSGWLGSATSVFDLANGQQLSWSTDNAGGVVVDNTHKILLLTNNDVGVAAAVNITMIGADA